MILISCAPYQYGDFSLRKEFAPNGSKFFPFRAVPFDMEKLNISTLDGFPLDWLQSLKQFFINVSYHILVASLTLMALLQVCDLTH